MFLSLQMATKFLRDLADRIDAIPSSADPTTKAALLHEWLWGGSWQSLKYKLDAELVAIMATKPTFTVRQICADDAKAAYSIDMEAFAPNGEAYPFEIIEHYAQAGSGYVVVTATGEVAGYVLLTKSVSELTPDKEVLTIASIATAAKFRRQGVAELLLKRVLQVTMEDVYLEVRTKNTAAIALYTKLGFKTAATLPNYYTKFTTVPDDAYYMRYQFVVPPVLK